MNILITGAWQGYNECKDKIEEMGHQVIFLQWEKDPLPCNPEWVEAIIGNGIFLNHKIEQFTNLKYIQITSAGYDRVPMDYVKEHGIEIHNARGVYSIPMAEFALSGVLQLYKQAKFFYDSQNKHQWNKHRGLVELYGKKACIVGCGSVGTECAKRFQAFGCQVVGVDLFPREDKNYEKMYALSELDHVLKETDILVLTLPLTEETKYLMNQERLGMLKESTIIVNIARGAVVDQKALVEALKDNKLGGAVLDVFEEEPLNEDSLLWDMENVILTPHNSFVGEGNQERLDQVIIKNLEI